MNWLIALGIVVVAAALEGVLTGKKPMAFLAGLDRPRWSLPAAGWIAVGLGFYAIVLVALARLIDAGTAGWPAIGLLVLVLAANAAWNFVMFRRRRLDEAYLLLFPYAVAVALAAGASLFVDPVSGGLVSIYLAFLLYDFAWSRSLRDRNPDFSRVPRQPRDA